MVVDLSIDSNSPIADFGLASLEANLNILLDIETTDFNNDSFIVPIHEGSDSETESNIPIHHIHSLNECLTLWIGDTEGLMFQIQERMKLWPNSK